MKKKLECAAALEVEEQICSDLDSQFTTDEVIEPAKQTSLTATWQVCQSRESTSSPVPATLEKCQCEGNYQKQN